MIFWSAQICCVISRGVGRELWGDELTGDGRWSVRGISRVLHWKNGLFGVLRETGVGDQSSGDMSFVFATLRDSTSCSTGSK